MQGKDYYQILGLSENATAEEIKKAYRKIAKENHPDRNPGDKGAEERFKTATEAYETLSDSEKRAKYDRLRKLGGGFGGFGFGGGGGGNRGTRYTTTEPDTGSFDDDYADFMRSYGTRSQQQRHGGSGSEAGGGGFGGFDDLLSNLFGGRRGGGRTETAANDASEPQPTDDPFFKRKGEDAYVDLKINVAQALLGSKVRVRTPSGKKVTVRIPPGTEPDKVLRVSGMGYQSTAGSGNLYIRLALTMPKNLTDEQKEAVAEAARSLNLKW